MTDLLVIPQRPKVEVIPPDDQIRLVVKKNPFLSGREMAMACEGQTIQGIVDTQIHAQYQPFVNAYVDGVLVPRNLWGHLRPKRGHEVLIAATPTGGGGGGSGRYIGAIVMIVVGALLWWAGGALLAAGAFANAVAASGMGMVISGAVSGVITALTSTPGLKQLSSGSDSSKSSPQYFIQGARNQARQFSPIPRIYGKHRIVPAYGAQPYTEILGDDQYLRLLFVLGYGPLEVSDLRIGDTSIFKNGIDGESVYEDFDYEVRSGFPNDDPITLYPSTVLSTPVSFTLAHDTWSQQTTSEDCDEISIDIEFPRGLALFQEDGDKKRRTVTIQVQYRENGTTPWLDVPTDVLAKLTISEKKTEPFARGFRWATGKRAKYDVQVKREKEDKTGDTIFEAATWTVLRTMRNDDPINQAAIFTGNTRNDTGALSLVAMRIKATDQLNSVIDTFNCMVRSIVPDYDSFALNFDGSAGYLNAGTGAQRTGAGERTIECWAYARATAGGLFQAGTTGTNNKDFSLLLLTPSTETWRINVHGAGNIDVVLPGSVGSWHHYALVYTGTNVILYFDGVEKVNQALTLNTGAHDLTIGRWETSYFSGMVREFRAWKQAKSAAQIAQRMNLVLLENPVAGGLDSYWHLSEGSGEFSYDYGDKGNHLDVSGSGLSWVHDYESAQAWTPRPTQNPASHFRDVLQGAGNKRPVADARVDLTTLQAWHDLNKECGEVLTCDFGMVADANAYCLADMSSVADYTLQSGDVLEYDIYWPAGTTANLKTALDLETGAGTKLRQQSAVDQNALSSAPATDLSAYAIGQWYHRKISIPAGMIGESVTRYTVFCDYDAGGAVRVYLRNIKITDGKGTVRKAIWLEGDAAPTISIYSRSSSDNTASLAAGAARAISKGRAFNFVFDYESNVYDTLQTIASTARASTTFIDGKFSVIMDVPKTIPVQHFTPRNSRDFRGIKIFGNYPHALKVRFVDEDNDYEQTEIIVYDDGYDSSNATLFEAIDLKGITNKYLAKYQARYMMALARLRPEAFEITTDFEYLVCTRGDLVKVTHDVPSIGLMSGRIGTITRNGSNQITAIALDAKVPMEVGKNYVLRVRLQDGTSSLLPVVTAAGLQSSVTLSTPTIVAATAGDLFGFGELDSESMDCIVSEIQPDADLAAKLTLVPAAPGVHTAEDGSIGEYDPLISSTPIITRTVDAPIITSTATDESVLVRLANGSWQPRILLKIKFPSSKNERPAYIQAQYRPAGTQSPYINLPYQKLNAMECYVTGVESKKTYDVRVRAISEGGIASVWTENLGIYVIGTSTPPPDITAFWIYTLPSGNHVFKWTTPSRMPLDFAGVKIRYKEGSSAGVTWADMRPLHAGLLTKPPYESASPVKRTTWTFGIKAVDVAGNESTNAVIIEKTFDVNPQGIIAQEDARHEGWPGTLTNGWINDHLDHSEMGEVQASDGKTWDSLASDGVTWAGWLEWTRAANDLTYEHPPIDTGSIQNLIPSTSKDYSGGTPTTEECHSNDGVTYSSWASIGAAINARYVKFRVSITGDLPILKEFIVYLR